MLTFKINKKEKQLISIRIDDELLKLIDKIATKNSISRNEMIIQCLRFAINNSEYKQQKEKVVN